MRKILLFVSLLLFLFSCEKEIDTSVPKEKNDYSKDQCVETAIDFVNETFVEIVPKQKVEKVICPCKIQISSIKLKMLMLKLC